MRCAVAAPFACVADFAGGLAACVRSVAAWAAANRATRHATANFEKRCIFSLLAVYTLRHTLPDPDKASVSRVIGGFLVMRRVCSLVLFVVLANAIPAFPQTPDGEARPIVVQGAMQIEVEKLVGRLENAT